MATAPPIEEVMTAFGTGVLRPLLYLRPNVSTNEPVNAENETIDSIIRQLPPYMRDSSIIFKSSIELYYQNTKNGLPLPSSLGDTGSAIQIDNLSTIQKGLESPDTAALVQQLMAFAARADAREIKFVASLAETNSTLAETNANLAETKTELRLVKTKVEHLEGQIIALLGDRAYLNIRSLFDASGIPLDVWIRSLGNNQAHYCSVSQYVSTLANGSWKKALNMGPQESTTPEGIERFEGQCRDIMIAGFRVDWPHLVRWTEGGQLILPGHLKWLLDASFKLFYWAKVQTSNINALPNNVLAEDRKAWWRNKFDFNRSPNETPRSLYSNFQIEYDMIINYLTTERDGGYLTVAKIEELLTTVDSPDIEITQLQMAWQSCCSYFWDIQQQYDGLSTKPPFILHHTPERISNLPVDITMAAVAEQPWFPINRVSKSVWMQRINLPLTCDQRFL